jgi:hypothetical protein
MRKFPIISLIWISILALIFQGCSFSRHLNRISAVHVNDTIINIETPFPENFQKVLYKSSLIFHGNSLNGLMMIKKTGEDSYRIAFFNELGMSFFDGELKAGREKGFPALKMNSVIPVLDRKRFLKSLGKDYGALLVDQAFLNAGNIFEEKETHTRIIQIHSGKGFNYFYVEPLSGRVKRIVNTGKLCGEIKTEIRIEGSRPVSAGFPEVIKMHHKCTPLDIEMKIINNSESF